MIIGDEHQFIGHCLIPLDPCDIEMCRAYEDHMLETHFS